MNRVRRVNQRGFSLSEIMIVAALGLIVVAATAVALGIFRERRTNETARLKLLSNLSQIKETIRGDIEVAVLNNGFTASLNADNKDGTKTKYFGLGTTEASSEIFEIQIFKPFNQGFSLPAQVNGDIAKISLPTTNKNYESYWTKAAASAEHFMFSNHRKAFIFPNAGSSITTGITTVGDTALSNALIKADWQSASNIVRTVEKVRLRHSVSEKTLMRIGHSGQDQNFETVVADNVLSFRVGYTFRRRDNSDQAAIPPLPPAPLTAENLPNTFPAAWRDSQEPICSSSPLEESGAIKAQCVKPQNINDVYVRLVMETDLSPSLFTSAQTNLSQDYQEMKVLLSRSGPDLNAKILATVDFRIRPKSYSTSLGENLSTGNNLNCSPTAENRCQPSCSGAFKNLDRNASDWIGYGRYVGHPDGASSYCQCWTNPRDWNKTGNREVSIDDWSQIQEWKSSSSTPEQNLQTEACGREYGCDLNWNMQWRHVGYQLACNCLRSDQPNYFVERNVESRPTFTQLTGPETQGFTLKLKDLNWYTDPYLAEILNQGALSRVLRCRFYQRCDGALTAYLSRTFGPQVSDSPYQNRCQCLTQDIPFACNTAAIAEGANPTSECLGAQGEPIDANNLNFQLICNQSARNSGGDLTCPNTWIDSVPNTLPTRTMPIFNVDLNANLSALHNPNEIPLTGGIYLGRSDRNMAAKLGIDPDIAEACECLENRVTGIQTGSDYQSISNPLNYTYPSNPRDLDFRSAGSSPTGFSSISYGSDGSNQDQQSPPVTILIGQLSQQFTVTPAMCANATTCTIAGQPVTCLIPLNFAAGQNQCLVFTQNNPNFTGATVVSNRSESSDRLCGRKFCSLGFDGFHCCAAPESQANPVVRDDLELWSGYCNSRCGGGLPSMQDINEIRAYITGEDINSLPVGCGGSASSSNGDGAL
jgi:prepilin-type N-terminal cleavage/methylation domain-containing protein